MADNTIEPGDWVVDKVKQDPETVYLVLEILPGNVPGYGRAKLRATHLPSKVTYDCTCGLARLGVIRKKDGTKLPVPW